MPENRPILPHESEDSFRDSLRHTAVRTGFREGLIEKDYFCSVLLRSLQPLFDDGLVFKGGTCLSKVHTAFFRMSEDLDFAIPPGENPSRSIRRTKSLPFRERLTSIAAAFAFFQVENFQPFNEHRQYTAEIRYRSTLTGQSEVIKIDLSVRDDEILVPSVVTTARTLVMDTVTNDGLIPEYPVRALSLVETYAEKTRAALTRRNPAIRDLFDIDHALRNQRVSITDQEYLRLLRLKLESTVEKSDLSEIRIGLFRNQVETHLKPVLRPEEYAQFIFDDVVNRLLEIERRLAE
jgi:predicted nucleotidyltransferase component of viral defense system